MRENLEMRDGFFVNDEKHQLEIIKCYANTSQIVLCNAVDDRRRIENAQKTPTTSLSR
jgi:hypothetical protein